VTVKNPCLSGGALEVFLEPHLPAPTMRVVGSAPIAIALAELAGRVGYAVESGQADLARPAPDDAAVVVASHGHDEERVLTEALRAGVPYVALVASEVRGGAVRESLDVSEEERARLHTPAGLEIGAETPEEIALAILAEIVSLRPEGEAGQVPRPRATGLEATPTDPPEPVRAEPAPVVLSTETAIDPVCGMEVAVSEASIHLERNGELHYFCSEGCRDTFSTQGVPDGAAH
jgi:xanthine dehydrogenase accessory factor